MSAVSPDICLAFIRKYLAGFRGYPRTEAGEKRFAEALRSNSLSPDHAEDILRSFDEEFPTVRQIHDVSANLAEKHGVNNERLDWQKKYGKPEPWEYPADELSMHWRAFRDDLYYNEGPGVGILLEIHDRKDRRKAIDWWADALEKDLKTHAESIGWVRAYIHSIGWQAAREQESAPEGMPYVNPRTLQRAGSLVAAGAALADSQREPGGEPGR